MNQSGILASEDGGEKMLENIELTKPPRGDERDLAKMRLEYAKDADPVGTLPGAAAGGHRARADGQARRAPGLRAQRHAPLRRADGQVRGGQVLPACPAKDLQHIRDEEAMHFALVGAAIQSLGGDPTAQTPSADVAGVEGMGLMQVLNDPKTTVRAGAARHPGRRDDRQRGLGRADRAHHRRPATTTSWRVSPRRAKTSASTWRRCRAGTRMRYKRALFSGGGRGGLVRRARKGNSLPVILWRHPNAIRRQRNQHASTCFSARGPRHDSAARERKENRPHETATKSTTRGSAGRRGGRERTQPAPMPSATELYEMICEAAYYRAEKRGFTPGLEAEDWAACRGRGARARANCATAAAMGKADGALEAAGRRVLSG